MMLAALTIYLCKVPLKPQLKGLGWGCGRKST